MTLGFLRRNLDFAPRQTKGCCIQNIGSPSTLVCVTCLASHVKTQIQQVEKVQRTAARWAFRRWRNKSSVGGMLDELEWPSLEARRE